MIQLLTFFFLAQSHAVALFIEPGFFVNMMDSSKAHYNDGVNKYDGTMRNSGFNYAVKFGLHYGHYEFGIESEVYDFIAHFEDSNAGGFTKDVNITYNSLFFGYEFIHQQFLYVSLSNTPYMTSGGKSFIEHGNVISLEYSNHLREWVSFNVKLESNSELEVKNGNQEFSFGNLLLIGFSFPIMADHDLI